MGLPPPALTAGSLLTGPKWIDISSGYLNLSLDFLVLSSMLLRLLWRLWCRHTLRFGWEHIANVEADCHVRQDDWSRPPVMKPRWFHVNLKSSQQLLSPTGAWQSQWMRNLSWVFVCTWNTQRMHIYYSICFAVLLKDGTSLHENGANRHQVSV